MNVHVSNSVKNEFICRLQSDIIGFELVFQRLSKRRGRKGLRRQQVPQLAVRLCRRTVHLPDLAVRRRQGNTEIQKYTLSSLTGLSG